jgi:hypothetical protein
MILRNWATNGHTGAVEPFVFPKVNGVFASLIFSRSAFVSRNNMSKIAKPETDSPNPHCLVEIRERLQQRPLHAGTDEFCVIEKVS